MAEDQIQTLQENAQKAGIPDYSAIIAKIDRTTLAAYLQDLMKKDIRDREEYGWDFMRQYDELAYEGFKKKVTKPWNNASNYAVCLTPTMVNVAHANTIGGIYSDSNKVVDCVGIGPEDIRTARLVNSLLNWQVLSDIPNAYDTVDKTVYSAYKHGNACIKVLQGVDGTKKSQVLWDRKPIEYIFLPVDAKGAQPNECDHIFELIPLTENEKKIRQNLKDPKTGEPLFPGIGDLKPGNKITASTGIDIIQQTKDATSGTSLGRRFTQDMYYIMECYFTYIYQENEESEPIVLELIAWMAPQGGDVYRVVQNTWVDVDEGEIKRPYSVKWRPYPHDDRFYGNSLPWMLKQTQTELDYSHNQVMNAVEKMIMSPTFYDPTSGIDPEETQQTPNGWYPVPDPNKNIFIPRYDYGPIFQHYRSFDLYWEYAQRVTGLTELFQGRQPERNRTLGEAELQVNKTEIRFKAVYDRFEQGWNELINLTFFYDKLFMSAETKIKVLGVEDYQSIGELFPEGIKGRYNFRFSSAPLTEKNRHRENAIAFFERATPIVAKPQLTANEWRMLNFLAQSYEIRNLETIIEKPREVNILSAEEAIQRIMSGEFNLMPDPQIDAPYYQMKIKGFMMTDQFKAADMKTRSAILLLDQRVSQILFAQNLAIQDAQEIKNKQMMSAQVNSNQPGQPLPEPTGA